MAGIQSAGDFIASAVVGLAWTLVSPTLAFGLAAALMVGSLATMMLIGVRRDLVDASRHWRAGNRRDDLTGSAGNQECLMTIRSMMFATSSALSIVASRRP